MTQLIDKEDALEAVKALPVELDAETVQRCIEVLSNQPTVDAVPVRHGTWTEKHHAYSDEGFVIEEWQSCRCSECGRYDTRPYMYYFDEPNFCSYCGADMRGTENDSI